MSVKMVNVIANTHIHGVSTHPLFGTIVNQELDHDQIYRCLIGGALVEEILPNGNRVQLNFKNYNKDNGGKIIIKASVSTESRFIVDPQTEQVVDYTKNKEEVPVEEVPVEEVPVEEVPVEEVPVEEVPVQGKKQQTYYKNKHR